MSVRLTRVHNKHIFTTRSPTRNEHNGLTSPDNPHQNQATIPVITDRSNNPHTALSFLLLLKKK